jgi:hypothetical protein
VESTINLDISKRINLKIEFGPIIGVFVLTEKMVRGRSFVFALPFTIFTLEIHNKLPLKDKE